VNRFLTLCLNPNAGKSCHCELLAQITELGLKHLSINSIVKERNCYEGYDDDLKSHIVDEDKVCLFFWLLSFFLFFFFFFFPRMFVTDIRALPKS